MKASGRIRFSLRTFLIGCVVASVILAVIISRYRAHDRWLHSIRTVGSLGGFGGFDGTFDVYQLADYHDQRGRPVAYALFVFDHYDPNLPATERRYRYDSWHGGILEVDGIQLDSMSRPALIVNGAYGYTARLEPTEDDLNILESLVANPSKYDLLLQFWCDRVEPSLFSIKGTTVAGQREGLWTYRLPDGSLYREANYQTGQRHGEWTSYYPDGSVQSRRHFDAGKPDGKWEYFDQRGSLLGSIEWDSGRMKTSGEETRRSGSGEGRMLALPSGKRTGSVFIDQKGGTFWIEGQAMQRPKLNFPLLVDDRDIP